ncbi:MAG: sensor histidine kinase [Bdellovibrionota bacterium]
MRARFFWIIFSVLTIVALGATLLHGQLLKNDRILRMDWQLREAANALQDSNFASSQTIDSLRGDNIINELLADSRIGKLFVVRDKSGRPIFESASVTLLSIKDIPRSPEWISMYRNGKFIRILNLQVRNFPDRTLQVGLVVDNSLISPAIFSGGNFFFVGSIFLLGSISAWALTSTLLRPISQFVNFITSISHESSLGIPALPKELLGFRSTQKKGDELRRLLDSFSSLIEQVNRGYKLSRIWSYQMAHEMKTPLAIMEGEISNALKRGELKPELATALQQELMEVSETVTEFLTWAELEGASAQKNLYAVSAHTTLVDIKRRLTTKFGGRLEIEIASDFYVLSNIQHFEHLLMNLITNALLYSPGETAVEVYSPAPQTIRIVDHGPGFPQAVLERIGEPFNRDDSVRTTPAKGNGLGLAYVRSVCRLYDWKFEINSSISGTEINLLFPDLAEDSLEESSALSLEIGGSEVAHQRT